MSRCIDVRNLCVYSGVTFSRSRLVEINMTRKQATIAVRSGLNDDEQYGCVVPPIHLSSTYNFIDFNQPRTHDYSRRGNPTRDVVQRALAELEGGAGAVMTSSGMSALHLVCTTFLQPGDLLVAPHDCYGGSYRLFDSLSKRGAYRVLFVDQGDEAALNCALAEKPKLVLIETPSNPLLRVVDIAAICQAARAAGALTVCDNTFLSPALQQPLSLGADLVVHSCTKYLNGHSDVVAGAVIAKDPELVVELAWWANNIGVTGAAFDSYLLLRGLRTLSPRMAQQQRNADDIVRYLQQQPLVKKLYHPSLPQHPGHEIACRQQSGLVQCSVLSWMVMSRSCAVSFLPLSYLPWQSLWGGRKPDLPCSDHDPRGYGGRGAYCRRHY